MLRQKRAPLPKSPRQIYHELTWDRTRVSAVTGWRPTPRTLHCLPHTVSWKVTPVHFSNPRLVFWGTGVAQRLTCCATNRKVVGSIPDGVIGIFH